MDELEQKAYNFFMLLGDRLQKQADMMDDSVMHGVVRAVCVISTEIAVTIYEIAKEADDDADD